MVGTVDLGNVRFSANFNTSGLDAGVSAMRKLEDQAKRSEAAVRKVRPPPTPDVGWIAGTRDLLKSLAAQSTLTLGPLSGVAARIQALNVLMAASGPAGAVAVGALSGVTVGLFAIGAAAIKSTMQIQKAELALKAVTNSAVEAKVQLDFVRQVSDQAGIGFTGAAKAWGRFEASAKAAGLTLDQTKKSFIETSLAAGTLQLGADDTQGVFRALEQILSKGTVQSEELRGQLADRFPAAFAIAAQAVGKTTKELGEMMKKGDVISKEFVPAFTAAMVKFYNIDPAKSIDSLQASLNRAANSWTFFTQAVDKAFAISAAFKNLIDGTSGALNYFAENMDNIKRVLGGILGAAAALAGAWVLPKLFGMAASAAGVLFAGLTRLITGFGGLQAANLALSIAFAATPWGAVITFAVRAAAAIGGWVVGMKLAEKVTNDLNKNLYDASKGGIKEFISQQMKLRTATNEATQEMIKQAEVGAKIADQEYKAAIRARQAAEAANKPGAILGQAAGFMAGPVGERNDPYGKNLQTNRAIAQAAASDKVVKALRDETTAAEKWAQAQKDVIDLVNISNKPIKEMASGLGDIGKSGADSTKKTRNGLASLLDTIEDGGYAIDKFKRQFEALQKTGSANSTEFLSVEALYKAQDALSRIEPGQLPKVNEALAKLGYTSGDTTARLAALFLQMDRGAQKIDRTKAAAEEASSAMRELFDMASKAQAAQDAMEGRLGALQAGGTAGAAQFDREKAVADQVRAYETLLKKSQLSTGMSDETIKRQVEAYQAQLAAIDQLGLGYDRQAEAIANAEQAMMSWYNTSMNSLLDVIFEAGNFGDAIGGIIKNLVRMAAQILIMEPLGNMMRQWVNGTNAQGNATGENGWGAMLAQMGMKMFGYANGGMPPVGQASIVGENGPELFVPTHTGRVVPNSKLTPSGNSSIIDARTYIDARGATVDAVAMLKQEMAIRDARLRAELPQMIDSRSRDSRYRLRG